MLVNFDSLTTVANGIKHYIDNNIIDNIADWNVNEENEKGYIKNKPFFSKIKINDSSYSSEALEVLPGGVYFGDPLFGSLEENGKYTVIFNNVEYNNLIPKWESPSEDMEFLTLGNSILDYSFSNFPFVIIFMEGQFGQISLNINPDEEYDIPVNFLVIDEYSNETIIDIQDIFEIELDSGWPQMVFNSLKADGNQIIIYDSGYALFNLDNRLIHKIKINDKIYKMQCSYVYDGYYQEFKIMDNDKTYGYLYIEEDDEIYIELEDFYEINKYFENCFIEFFSEEEIIQKIPFKYQHQTDWNAVGEGSILNKPFGEYFNKINILTNHTCNFDEDNYYHTSYDDFWTIVDTVNYSTKFNITFDGVLYENVTFKYDLEFGYPTIGDSYCEIYPFVIYPYYDDSDQLEMLCSSSGEHEITIEAFTVEIKKINPLYQTSPDWNEVNPDSGSCIKNKPFGLEMTGNCFPLLNDTLSYQDYENDYAWYTNYYFDSSMDLMEIFDTVPYIDVIIGDTIFRNVPYKYQEDWDCYGFGNVDFIDNGIVTDYPFFITVPYWHDEGNNKILIQYNKPFTNTDFTIMIPEIQTKKMPLQYLPYEIVTELPTSPDENTFYIIFEEE